MDEKQQEEWQRCAEDMEYFADNQVYLPGHEGKVKYETTDAQRILLKDIGNNHFVVRRKSRRVGFSCTAGNVAALHRAIFHRGSRICLISHSIDAAAENLRSIMFTHHELPDDIKQPILKKSRYLIAFGNGSELHVVSMSSDRWGVRYDTVIIDDPLNPSVPEWALSAKTIVFGMSTLEPLQKIFPHAIYGEMPWDSMPGRDQAYLDKLRKGYPNNAAFAKEILLTTLQ